MARHVTCWVHVGGAVFGPGDVPPPQFAEQIRNPACWSEEESAFPAPPAPADPDPAPVPEQPAAPSQLDPPPRSGRGSGRDHWAEYAAANGVEVGEGDGRDEIIAALDAAGVSTGEG